MIYHRYRPCARIALLGFPRNRRHGIFMGSFHPACTIAPASDDLSTWTWRSPKPKKSHGIPVGTVVYINIWKYVSVWYLSLFLFIAQVRNQELVNWRNGWMYGGFLKWWVSPTNPWVFLLKMISTWGVKWGYHHLRKHPYESVWNVSMCLC